MLNNLLSSLERRNAAILFMVHPGKPDPLFPSPRQCILQRHLVQMILQREDIQRPDSHSPLEILEQNSGLYAAHHDRSDLANEVHALTRELVYGRATDGSAGEGDELEEPRTPGDGAGPDKEGTRDKEGVQEVEGDLVVLRELVYLGDGGAVVGGEGGEEEGDGREEMFV